MQTKKTLREQYQELIHEYRKSHGNEWQPQAVAEWGIRTGRIVPHKVDVNRMIAKEIARAARDEYYTDPQGRRVRVNHPRREKSIIKGELVQKTWWDTIWDAKPEHMKLSLQGRRQGILWDCNQHKIDTDSYNENNKYGAQLAFDYDFNSDLEELQQPTDYPDAKPSDDDGGEDGEP